MTVSQSPPRGRPRSERARKAILDAATDMFLELGLEAVSMEAVAERAEVSKATIYRWWPSKEVLALDAIYTNWAVVSSSRDTGTLRGDLLSLILPWVRELGRKPFARIVAQLAARVQTDPDFGELWRERFVEPRRAPARAIFARAVERGEIDRNLKLEVALDLLYGPLYHRLLHGHAPLTERFARDVIDILLGGLLSVSQPR